MEAEACFSGKVCGRLRQPSLRYPAATAPDDTRTTSCPASFKYTISLTNFSIFLRLISPCRLVNELLPILITILSCFVFVDIRSPLYQFFVNRTIEEWGSYLQRGLVAVVGVNAGLIEKL